MCVSLKAPRSIVLRFESEKTRYICNIGNNCLKRVTKSNAHHLAFSTKVSIHDLCNGLQSSIWTESRGHERLKVDGWKADFVSCKVVAPCHRCSVGSIGFFGLCVRQQAKNKNSWCFVLFLADTYIIYLQFCCSPYICRFLLKAKH